MRAAGQPPIHQDPGDPEPSPIQPGPSAPGNTSNAPVRIGPVRLDSPVILAPLSGITDLPFRETVRRYGPELVVTEMVASEERCRDGSESLRRASGSGAMEPLSVQLAGREARWMGQAAKLVADGGARIIDINMGCPARKVTGGQSGSALMRDLDHALDLIKATVDAVSVPVTLKMRMGWDETSLNAPELAARAEEAGVRMVTVHGRTRCQFYEGTADWAFIARVKAAVSIPVVANGDITSPEAALSCLEQSGADAVMVGRGVQGRPWFLSQLTGFLETGVMGPEPEFEEKGACLMDLYARMLDHYGPKVGVRAARKHLAWTLERLPGGLPVRDHVVRLKDPDEVRHRLDRYFSAGPALDLAA